MTEAQLISIAVTVLAVLAGMISTDRCVGKIEKRFDDTNGRIDDFRDVLRGEVIGLGDRMEMRFDSIDRKLDEFLLSFERRRGAV